MRQLADAAGTEGLIGRLGGVSSCFHRLLRSFQPFDVAQILGPAGCALVADERRAGDERNGDVAKWARQSIGPGLGKAGTGELGEDVDAARRHADLIGDPFAEVHSSAPQTELRGSVSSIDRRSSEKPFESI